MTLVLVSMWSVGIAVSVIYLCYGMLYLGPEVHNLEQDSWFATTEYGCKSLAIKVAIEFVIRFALSELGESFDIACYMVLLMFVVFPKYLC